MGMEAAAPEDDVTVTVTVWLLLVAPAEKVKGTSPLLSVGCEEGPTCPADADTVSTSPTTLALPEVNAVAVSVTSFVPSLLTLVPLGLMVIFAAGGVPPGGVVGVVMPLPPQLVSAAVNAANIKVVKVLA